MKTCIQSQQKINEDERGKLIDPILNIDFLTKDDFLELYQICSSVIHAENPYVDKPKLPRLIDATFKKWYDKVYNLISFHVLVLYRMEYTFMVNFLTRQVSQECNYLKKYLTNFKSNEPLTRGLAQWRDITSVDRYNIFELLNMGWAALPRTIATAPSPDRYTPPLAAPSFIFAPCALILLPFFPNY